MFRLPKSRSGRATVLLQAVFVAVFVMLAVRDVHAARWGWLLFDVALLGMCAGVLWVLCRRPSGGAK